MTQLDNGWMAPIFDMLDAHAWRGQYLMAIQAYRPDVVRMIANQLGLVFCDFRAEHMAPLGCRAASLTLEALNEVVVAARAEQGLVFHNVEALLAAKTPNERCGWFSQFVEEAGGYPILVPVSVFCNEPPKDCGRVAWIDPTDLPEEKLLMRLATQ